MNCQGILGSSTILGLSPPPPPKHRRSNHLPRLAEATAGPEDVVLVLVATPCFGQELIHRLRSFVRRW